MSRPAVGERRDGFILCAAHQEHSLSVPFVGTKTRSWLLQGADIWARPRGKGEGGQMAGLEQSPALGPLDP